MTKALWALGGSNFGENNPIGQRANDVRDNSKYLIFLRIFDTVHNKLWSIGN